MGSIPIISTIEELLFIGTIIYWFIFEESEYIMLFVVRDI